MGLYSQILSCPTDAIASRSFTAAFFGKPSSTLAKRANSIRLYIRWAQASGRKPFPLSEEGVFSYLDDLNLEGAPPTRAASFKEALNFAKGYAGLGGVTEVLSSRRVQGAALASYSRKREVLKRLALSKVEILRLEAFLADPSGAVRDRVLAGFLLFCLFARLRVGDATRLDQEPTLDVISDSGEGYIEAGLLEHKTSSRVKARVRLPVAGSAIGLSGSKWAKTWLDLRSSQGLNASTDKCLITSPGIDGTWTRKRLHTSDCTTWIRELFKRILDLDSARLGGLGSHSLKATLLSWSAKYGLTASVRRRLGGHVKPGGPQPRGIFPR